MSKAEDIWNTYKDLLKKSYVERDFNAWGQLWAENGRLIVKLGRESAGGYLEEAHAGRNEIVAFFSGSGGRLEAELVDDGPVYEAANTPGSFMVISDFVATILATGARYPNRIVCRVSFDGQGRITEFVEYADPIRRANFLQALRSL